MLLYHTYDSKRGKFDPDKMDYDRGIFSIQPWWAGEKGYEKYSVWHPNEFGDTVVELELDDNAKTFTAHEQEDTIQKIFPDSKLRKKLLNKLEDMDKDDWAKIDATIGKRLKKNGYQLIHYDDDPMYGDAWVIIDKNIIRDFKHDS